MSEAYAEFQHLLKQKKYREAALHAEREHLKGSPQNAFWLTRQAAALIRASDHEQALEVARRALSLEPGNPYAVIAAADALLSLQKTEEALRHYLEVLSDTRLSHRSRWGVMECLCRLKRWEEVLSRLGQWAAPEAESLPWRVKALAGLKRSEEAIEQCRRWLELAPDHPPALWALTELEVQRDGLEEVLGRLGRLVRIPSISRAYREIYASLCRRAGRPEAALKEYEKLGAEGAQPKVQRQEAFTLAKAGREREALPLLEELLRANPTDRYLHASYEAACRRIGEVERGINFYNALLGLHPQVKSLYGHIRRLQRKLEGPP